MADIEKEENNKSQVISFGCRLNTFEAEVIEEILDTVNPINTFVFNTCAVTNEAVRRARQAIRRLRRNRPHATIIVSGCAAQIDPDKFLDMPEVDKILGNEDKFNKKNYIAVSNQERITKSDIMSVDTIDGHFVKNFRSKTRAFVQIQQGCDHRCTFCVVPFGRGNSRSVPFEFVNNQIKSLTNIGYKECTLTGVDISSYGKDLPERLTLGLLVRRLLDKNQDLERLRLSTLDPGVEDDALLSVLSQDPRLMPHLHLSVQSGDDTILKRMKRRHSRSDVVGLVEKFKLARKDIVLGADLIAGFPTESETMFNNTMEIIDDAGLTYLHVFPFSSRKFTAAAKMPQVPKTISKNRANTLRKIGATKKLAYFSHMLGSTAKVLTEGKTTGYTEHYAPVKIDNFPQRRGVYPINIIGRTDQYLIGERIL